MAQHVWQDQWDFFFLFTKNFIEKNIKMNLRQPPHI